MPTGPGFPSSTNVFVPNLEASGRLTVGYSRNTDLFNLPSYARYVQTDQSVGLYMKLSAQEAARVVTQAEYEWPDGQVRPVHTNGLEQFNMLEFRTHRYDYGFTVGWMTKNQASWPIVEQHSQIHAAKCMTARTVRMLAVATTAANWTVAGSGDPDLSADHTAASATAFGVGGPLGGGTSADPRIKKALDKIAVLVSLDTLGTVESSQLQVIINPNEAKLWAESAEIHDYIKGSYHAKEEINSGLGPNNKFGLPSSIYGYPIIVEKCVKVTSRKGATLTKAFALPDATVLVVGRPGGLDGVYGAPDFSTLTMFYYGPTGEMALQTFDDPKNELTEGHVVENTAEVLTSPLSGFLLLGSQT